MEKQNEEELGFYYLKDDSFGYLMVYKEGKESSDFWARRFVLACFINRDNIYSYKDNINSTLKNKNPVDKESIWSTMFNPGTWWLSTKEQHLTWMN